MIGVGSILPSCRKRSHFGMSRWIQPPPEGIRLRGQAATAARLATEAVDIAFSTAGSTSAGMVGTRLAKYYQDAAFYKTHIGAQHDVFYGSQGRVALGLPAGGM